MKIGRFGERATRALPMLLVMGLLSGPAMAHCDSMDGPVVADAQRALSGKVMEPVLKWIRAEDEAEIRRVFAMALAVRGESEAARNVADLYFFETLVRIHRAGEGEGFMGLQPAGSVEPAIAAADRALVDGNIEVLADRIAASVRQGIVHRFGEARELRPTAEQSTAQGRRYVAAYVQLTHFVESADRLVANGASHQHPGN